MSGGGGSLVSALGALRGGVGGKERGNGWLRITQCTPPVALGTGVEVTSEGQAAGTLQYTCAAGFYQSSTPSAQCSASACGVWLRTDLTCSACQTPPAANPDSSVVCSGDTCTYVAQPARCCGGNTKWVTSVDVSSPGTRATLGS